MDFQVPNVAAINLCDNPINSIILTLKY